MTPDDLFGALDATWPAAHEMRQGSWVLRDGQGGGQRVSATLLAAGVDAAAITDADVRCAADAQTAAGHAPLFALRGAAQTALDNILVGQGYTVNDPTVIYAAPTATLKQEPEPTTLFEIWPPLAIMRDLWAAAGTGPARIAVMDRAAAPKTSLIARHADRAVGVGFVACHDGIAMLHAVEVSLQYRRKGAGVRIVQGAAWWAASQGAHTFALAVTARNAGARALYERLGMTQVVSYHYRAKSARAAD